MNSAGRWFAPLALAIAVGFSACRKSQDTSDGDAERKIPRFSLASETDSAATAKRCMEMCRKIGSLYGDEQEKALASCAGRFLDMRLDETSYGKRLASIERYLSLVGETFDALAKSAKNPEVLWNFRLDTLRKFGREQESLKAGIDTVKCEHAPSGNLMTERLYRELLEDRKFRAVQDAFETGAFSVYYNGLSGNARAAWMSKIREVAGREVVIYDPQRPFRPLPRHKPSDGREWQPSSPGKPREYIEHLENGQTIRMKEVRK